MNTFLNALENAHRICVQAQPHLNAARHFSSQAAQAEAAGKKSRIWKTIAACAGSYIAGGLLDALAETLHLSFLRPVLLILTQASHPCVAFLVLRSCKAATDRKVRSLREKAAQQNRQGLEILNTHSAELAFLPQEYRYPMATEYLIKVVSAGRAENLSQALDLSDTYLHR